jgi:pilus assembly protein CpaE
MKDPARADELAHVILGRDGFHISDDGRIEGALLFMEIGPEPEQDFESLGNILMHHAPMDVILVSERPDPEILIRAMRLGIQEFLPMPLDQTGLEDALKRFRMRAVQKQQASGEISKSATKGRIVYLFGGKGGVGNTTLAVNTAMELMALHSTKKGKQIVSEAKVALLDMGMPQGETPVFLDLKYDYTWGEAARNITRLDETFLLSIMAEHKSGLFVLPAPNQLEDASVFTAETAEKLPQLMKDVFDYTIIDGSHYLDEISVKVMEAADDIVLVMVLSLPCLSNVKKLLDTFKKYDPELEQKIHLVVNRKLNKSEISINDAEKLLGKKIFKQVENDYMVTMNAINQGKPVHDMAPKAKVSKDIAALAKALTETKRPESGEDKGLFSKFFSKDSAEKDKKKNAQDNRESTRSA